MQIKQILSHAYQQLTNISETPELDAQLLLAYNLQHSRAWLFAHDDEFLNSEQVQRYLHLLEQRCEGYPLAYLTGQKEFWSLNFKVSPDVLIPRPETEILISQVLERFPLQTQLTVADLGTGSGIIALVLGRERPHWNIYAVDHSQAAIAIARQNASVLQVHQVTFILSDWFKELQGLKFDLICANPPYIAEDEWPLLQKELSFEPRRALIAEDRGLREICTIIKESRLFLNHGGMLILEHGAGQAQAIQALMRQIGFHSVTTQMDLAGQPRTTLGFCMK